MLAQDKENRKRGSWEARLRVPDWVAVVVWTPVWPDVFECTILAGGTESFPLC